MPKETSGLLMNVIGTLSSMQSNEQRDLEKAKLEREFKLSDQRLERLVSANHRDLANVMHIFSKASSRINEARTRIATVKGQLAACRGLLHCRRDELKKLWPEGVEHKQVLLMLDQIEVLKEMPEEINRHIIHKNYLAAAQLVVKAKENFMGPLMNVDALKEVRSELEVKQERLYNMCGCNVIRGKPFDVEIQSPRFQDPVKIQPPELTDGTTVDSDKSPPLPVAGAEMQTFHFNELGKCPIRQVWIYTKGGTWTLNVLNEIKMFPMYGDCQITPPANWSYEVTTETSMPSIVITNDNLQVVDEARIGIWCPFATEYSLDITELEAYANCGCIESKTSTDEVEIVHIWAVVATDALICALGVGIYVVIKRKSLRNDKHDTV